MENTDFYINKSKTGYNPLTVNAVYHVIADSEYNIGHSKIRKSYVLIANTNGSGYVNINNEEYLLESNYIFIFDASKSKFDYHSNDSWSFWWVEFEVSDPDFIEAEMQKSFYHPLSETEQNMFYSVLDFLKYEDSKTASYLFSGLICLLQKGDNENSSSLQSAEKVKKADMYIRKNISDATPEKVSLFLGISTRTLFNIFRRELNTSPADYIRDMKMNRAKYILKTTDTSIRDIADYLGFADQFTFSKSFKQHFGISPAQCRNEI